MSSKFLLLHGKFEYDQKEEFHTADKVVQVPCLPEGVHLTQMKSHS